LIHCIKTPGHQGSRAKAETEVGEPNGAPSEARNEHRGTKDRIDRSRRAVSDCGQGNCE